MQVTETLSEGLKREFQVVLPLEELEGRLTEELETLKGKVQIKGFRPGKVPVTHLRRLYGRSVMADVVQNAVTEANRKIVEENGLKLAFEPKVDFPEDKETVEKTLDAKADLAFKVALEVMPTFALADLSDVTLTKLVTKASDAEVDEAIERMAKTNRPYADKAEGAAAETGDRLSIDFLGRIDGEPFEGGKGEGIELEIGSGTFIPGFEEQLVGTKVGDERLVNFRRLMAAGASGKLESAVPPITVPAWMCMATSQDPGSLGVYGFHNRVDHSYDGLGIVRGGRPRPSARTAPAS